MATQPARFETDGSLRLVGEVNLESVSGLVAAADSQFAQAGESCVIDLSGLEKSDSATVALLLEWKRRARSNGCELGYTHIPGKLLDIARISQLESLLQG